MKQKDLRSLKKNPELARQIEGMDPESIEQMQQTVAQYQGKSEGELYDELRSKVKNGSINQARISEMAEKLIPLLDSDHQRRLREIINNIKRNQ